MEEEEEEADRIFCRWIAPRPPPQRWGAWRRGCGRGFPARGVGVRHPLWGPRSPRPPHGGCCGRPSLKTVTTCASVLLLQ